MPSETDIFMSLFYMLAGSLLVGVFSQGMRALTWASKYTCTTGDNTCKVLRDVAMRVRVFFSDVLAVKDLEKGVGGGIQVVVLVGILIVLVSLLRTASADAKPKTVVRCVGLSILFPLQTFCFFNPYFTHFAHTYFIRAGPRQRPRPRRNEME